MTDAEFDVIKLGQDLADALNEARVALLRNQALGERIAGLQHSATQRNRELRKLRTLIGELKDRERAGLIVFDATGKATHRWNGLVTKTDMRTAMDLARAQGGAVHELVVGVRLNDEE